MLKGRVAADPVSGAARRISRGPDGMNINEHRINDTLELQSQRGRMGRRDRRRPLNFEKFAAEGNRFINDVAFQLGVTRNSAARITKAVLQAIRDRMPANDAVEFAQGLPMALKGVFVEQYDISDTPVPIRRAEDFLDYVALKNDFSAVMDFPDRNAVAASVRGVFRVLECYMDPGQVEQVRDIIGEDIARLTC